MSFQFFPGLKWISCHRSLPKELIEQNYWFESLWLWSTSSYFAALGRFSRGNLEIEIVSVEICYIQYVYIYIYNSLTQKLISWKQIQPFILIHWPLHFLISSWFLGGGNSNYFHIENWGNDPIWRAYFSNGWQKTTNQVPSQAYFLQMFFGSISTRWDPSRFGLEGQRVDCSLPLAACLERCSCCWWFWMVEGWAWRGWVWLGWVGPILDLRCKLKNKTHKIFSESW